jgi:Cft2 family RNA processing exonuclease
MSNVDDILKKTAEYIETSQAELAEKNAAIKNHEERDVSFSKQASRTAAVLADRGILQRARLDEFSDKVAEDPNYALTFMEKLAKLVGSDQLGQSSDIYKTSSETQDPWEKVLFPELKSNNGLVD